MLVRRRGLKSTRVAASYQPLPQGLITPPGAVDKEHETLCWWNRGLQRLFAIEDVSIFIYWLMADSVIRLTLHPSFLIPGKVRIEGFSRCALLLWIAIRILFFYSLIYKKQTTKSSRMPSDSIKREEERVIGVGKSFLCLWFFVAVIKSASKDVNYLI